MLLIGLCAPAIFCDRVASAATIARKVIANFAASAFFRGTTQILPLFVPGVSSLLIKSLACLIFSSLLLLSKTVLLLASAMTMVLSAASVTPVPDVSRALLKIAAISMASACLILIVCTSPVVGLSIDEINLAIL